MTAHIWLRAETKDNEERSALTPRAAKVLLEAGFQLTVERSFQSAIPADDFADLGCKIVTPGAWPTAPDDAYILGLKELPNDGTPLRHRHIYFAHAFKGQDGWRDTLSRFARGISFALQNPAPNPRKILYIQQSSSILLISYYPHA